MRVKFATLAMLGHSILISATADVCAQQAKTDPTPNCNAIHYPGLHDIVQGGKPYNIRWDNNTGTSVSLALCQGPSFNCQEIGCIVDHAPNIGSFLWTPATNLVPHGDHNYGLKIIADTGDFQWSVQFGISNSMSTSSSSSSMSSASLIPSKEAVIESTRAAKERASAVKQASSEQIEGPTSTVNTTKHHAKNTSDSINIHAKSGSKTHSKHHTHIKATASATGKHHSAHLVHHEGANTTHTLKHHKSYTLPSIIVTSLKELATESTASSGNGSVTQFLTPTVAPSVLATPPATTAAPPTSLKTSFSAGGAARAAVTGVPLVLGAMAALVL